MYCHDCGTDNTVDSKYCKECGIRVNDGYRAMMQSVQDPLQDQSDEDTDALTRLLDMAFWHNQAGNIDAAITASEAALALSPNSTTAHSLLGTLYEKKGDDAEAIRHFEAVLVRNPDSAADAAKLDQLRRGVHVKAVAPPVAHQWLPPALLKFAAQARQRTETVTVAAGNVSLPAFTQIVSLERIDPQRRPFYLAGAVASVVFVSLLLSHPWAQAQTAKNYPIIAPTPTAVDRSAYAAPAALAPVVMMPPSSSASNRAYSPAPMLSANDPFAGHVPTSPTNGSWSNGKSGDLSSSPWSLPPVRSRSASQNRRVARRDLPPLRLSALPADNSDEIAPAPVSLPDGLSITSATAASVPQHTVMVSSLATDSNSSNFSSANNSPQADPASHIHITVNQVRDSSTSALETGNVGAGTAGNAGVTQQRALTLQQGGDYRQARLVYQSAIRAYQSQIAAGQDVETAQRGLAACQTGLQICQQSQ